MLGFDISGTISNIHEEQLGQISNIERPPIKSDAHQKQFLHIMNFARSVLTGGSIFLLVLTLVLARELMNVIALSRSLYEIAVSIIFFIFYLWKP